MSVYSSSPFNFSGYTFVSLHGPVGNRGPTGSIGPAGNPGFGPTGPTGSGITFFTYINDIINTVYNDDSVRSSLPITKLPGNYLFDINGSTGGNFSPLASTGITTNINVVYDGTGQSTILNVARILTFKNLKTNTPDFVTLSYFGPPLSPAGEPGQAINLAYNVFNLGTSNITSGPNGSLVVNNPGNFQTGFTGTTYNISENAVGFSTLDVAEQLVIVKPSISLSNLQAWYVDPEIGSVFYLTNFNTITSPSGLNCHHIIIKQDITSNTSKAFTLILPNSFHSANIKILYSTCNSESDIVSANFTQINFRTTFRPNVIWQSDSYFCPSQNFDIINFISVGSRYVGIPVYYNLGVNNTDTIKTSLPGTSCRPPNVQNLYRSTQLLEYGLCCKSDCTCSLEYKNDCSGYFYSGATCGGPTGPCSTLGACCIFSSDKSNFVSCQELSYCQCATVASESNMAFVWNPFTSIRKSCLDYNCQNAKNKIGACCDGTGNCIETTQEICSELKYFYSNDGVNCTTSENLNICLNGVGGCCDSGVACTPGITGINCIMQNKTYYGDGTTCDTFLCSPSEIPCYSIIENETLWPGKEYDGGIVVGIFNPKQTECLGSKIFDGSVNDFNTLTGLTFTTCETYFSNYDYAGYGFDQINVCDDNFDSYIMLISPHPVNINTNKTLIDGQQDTHKFTWSNGSVAWGPLIDIGSNTINEFDVNNLQYKEGYIFSDLNPLATKQSLYQNTFLTCSSARVDTNAITSLENRPAQSMTGLWTRNYGLYNTIRLSGAEYFYYNIGISSSGATLINYTPQSNEITAARALSIYALNKPSGQTFMSDWFIPSIDELAYIAKQCSNTSENNLNSTLLQLGYSPIQGWHWSSTGALNIQNNEGILSATGITHGTEAWGIYVDVDGIESNMKISRKPRTEQMVVRPIKFIRCDKKLRESTDNNFRLWNVPKLSESIINN